MQSRNAFPCSPTHEQLHTTAACFE